MAGAAGYRQLTASALVATPFGVLAAGTLIDSLGLSAATVLFGGICLVVTLIPAVPPVCRQTSEPTPGPMGGHSRLSTRGQLSARRACRDSLQATPLGTAVIS
jgi:hypothetical protein